MTRHYIRKLIVAIGLLGLSSILLVLLWLQQMSKGIAYEFDVPADASLTEELALKYSKQALMMDGKESANMSPVRYRDADDTKGGDSYLARNTIDPNIGSVLWSVNDSGHHTDYSVRVSLRNGKVHCEVFRLK